MERLKREWEAQRLREEARTQSKLRRARASAAAGAAPPPTTYTLYQPLYQPPLPSLLASSLCLYTSRTAFVSCSPYVHPPLRSPASPPPKPSVCALESGQTNDAAEMRSEASAVETGERGDACEANDQCDLIGGCGLGQARLMSQMGCSPPQQPCSSSANLGTSALLMITPPSPSVPAPSSSPLPPLPSTQLLSSAVSSSCGSTANPPPPPSHSLAASPWGGGGATGQRGCVRSLGQ